MAIKALNQVRFNVCDLDAQEAFAANFGLITQERTDEYLVMRTQGGDLAAYVAFKSEKDAFIGAAFEADDTSTLDAAIAEHGALELDPSLIPGAARAVELTDPNGYQVLIVDGVERRVAEDIKYSELVLNTPYNIVRRGRKQATRDLGPARLWKLGHFAIFVKSYDVTAEWYREKLGIIPSDTFHVPGMPDARIVGFHRLNRGDEYVDHHLIAFMQDEETTGCHHISFEVQDFEAQFRTHRFLKDHDYELVWGVGRHPEGCHIFDVWKSPADGTRFETYSDTDQFREADGAHLHDISKTEMDVWLSDGPERYFI